MSNRKSAFSPTSRARRLRLAPRDPRRAEFATRRFGPRPRLAADTELRRGHQGPGVANLSRRDRAAWAAALGVRVAPVRGHRGSVPLNDASRSALGWTGLRVYLGPNSRAGISTFFAGGAGIAAGIARGLLLFPLDFPPSFRVAAFGRSRKDRKESRAARAPRNDAEKASSADWIWVWRNACRRTRLC